MSKAKKLLRQQMREATFERDGNRCAVCGDATRPLDAHHPKG